MKPTSTSSQQQFLTLFKKEWQVDLRHRSAFYGVFLYSLLTVFLIAFAFKQADATTWVCLFWITTLFAALNAMAKSFLQESATRWNYYYTLFSPTQLLLTKLLYNFCLLGSITVFNLILFSLFLGFPIVNVSLFLLNVLLGVMAFVILFSLISAIAAKASKNASLAAILSLPVMIPMLSVLINFSMKTTMTNDWQQFTADIILLSSINILMLGLSVLLFRFTWRD